MTQRQAAERLEWSLSKLLRIEAGTTGLSVTDLRAMLQLYQVTDDDQAKRLMEAARGSRGQSWWSQYRDVVSPQFAHYLGHEGAACSIRVFHPYLVPGLLHTRQYATELLRVHSGPERTRRTLNLRTSRQQNLFEHPGRADGPDMTFLLGEEALHRLIGGPAVMHRQLRLLLELGTNPNVSVQIVPFTAGAHPGLLGPFILLGFEDSAEELLFFEGLGGDLVSRDDQEQVVSFRVHFEAIRDLALPADQARTLLEDLISRLGQADEAGPDHLPGPGTPRAAAELDVPELRSRLADLGDVRWVSGAGPQSLPPCAPIGRTTSSASSTSSPATRPGPAASWRSPASSSWAPRS